MATRTVFFLSDRTGITVDVFGSSLLSQFDGIDFNRIYIPYLDTEEKLEDAIRRIEAAAEAEHHPPLVFSTLVQGQLRERLRHSNCSVYDLFDTFISAMERDLESHSVCAVGRSHGIGNLEEYERRVESMNFTLSYDDGARLTNLERADVILLGVSRSGKTPTCLYLSLHYGIYAANYPLTQDDLDHGGLPRALAAHKPLLFGLTIIPERLAKIREARRPGSSYASLETCRREVRQAEELYQREGIPLVNSSSLSIEEIATAVMHRMNLMRHS
ncbi:MAG: phosphoenolpyruvate synthase regulatory protein [Gammaproteobacteria bacterium RIFOXYA12_FULL_61_12]|nr:MAG: phosphoenolpyruvate synthase regulatory protein [Gammaproteobacteria bacterium RIFOXYD12_FULL_61_37]OGT92971.1 MAG: phosphoenolpyruvate synthase regulatory protein [Gammaproteobacteria bacterium RIFOXYA12_FULL_61_12]